MTAAAPGPVGALDVPVREAGEYMLDGCRIGDEHGGHRPESERGDAADRSAHLRQQLHQFAISPRTPSRHDPGLGFGNRPSRAGNVREGAEAGFGVRVSSPGDSLGLAATGRGCHGLYGRGHTESLSAPAAEDVMLCGRVPGRRGLEGS